jgi:hypothetical protein
MFGLSLLAYQVPLFAATKAEKAFGFRVNRVYLTRAGARKPFIRLPNLCSINPTVASIPIFHRDKANGGTTVAMKN